MTALVRRWLAWLAWCAFATIAVDLALARRAAVAVGLTRRMRGAHLDDRIAWLTLLMRTARPTTARTLIATVAAWMLSARTISAWTLPARTLAAWAGPVLTGFLTFARWTAWATTAWTAFATTTGFLAPIAVAFAATTFATTVVRPRRSAGQHPAETGVRHRSTLAAALFFVTRRLAEIESATTATATTTAAEPTRPIAAPATTTMLAIAVAPAATFRPRFRRQIDDELKSADLDDAADLDLFFAAEHAHESCPFRPPLCRFVDGFEGLDEPQRAVAAHTDLSPDMVGELLLAFVRRGFGRRSFGRRCFGRRSFGRGRRFWLRWRTFDWRGFGRRSFRSCWSFWSRGRCRRRDWICGQPSSAGLGGLGHRGGTELCNGLHCCLWSRERGGTLTQPRLSARAMLRSSAMADGDNANAKGFRRLNFFRGQKADWSDWYAEIEYRVEKHRLHNRLLHSPGVIREDIHGLQVTARGDMTVEVKPGFALDGRGNEICLEDIAIKAISTNSFKLPQETVYIVVRYLEEPTDFIAYKHNLAIKGHRRIQEGAEAAVVMTEPKIENEVEIARILVDRDAKAIHDPKDPYNPGPNEVDIRYVRSGGRAGSHIDGRTRIVVREAMASVKKAMLSIAKVKYNSQQKYVSTHAAMGAAATLQAFIHADLVDKKNYYDQLGIVIELVGEVYGEIGMYDPDAWKRPEFVEFARQMAHVHTLLKERRQTPEAMQVVAKALGNAGEHAARIVLQ
jgi:hypothetical protein